MEPRLPYDYRLVIPAWAVVLIPLEVRYAALADSLAGENGALHHTTSSLCHKQHRISRRRATRLRIGRSYSGSTTSRIADRSGRRRRLLHRSHCSSSLRFEAAAKAPHSRSWRYRGRFRGAYRGCFHGARKAFPKYSFATPVVTLRANEVANRDPSICVLSARLWLQWIVCSSYRVKRRLRKAGD